MNCKKTIGVICGGEGPEHEIDLITAKDVFLGLDKSKYDVVLIGISKKGNWHFSKTIDLIVSSSDVNNVHLDLNKPIITILQDGKVVNSETNLVLAVVDVFFPITDDPIQESLDRFEQPYTGSDFHGTELGKDKDTCKNIVKSIGIPITRHITLSQVHLLSFRKASNYLGTPFFIKPNSLGSSIGVSRVETEAGFQLAVEHAFKFDSKILLEKAVYGKEIGCAVIGNSSPIPANILAEISLSNTFFTYEAKYSSDTKVRIIIPANLDHINQEKIRQASVKIFKVLRCKGFARVDFFLQDDGTFVFMEINTSPGLGKCLMFPKLWCKSGVTYPELLDQIIDLGIERFKTQVR